MNQHTLWIDSWSDAVSTVIDACGGPKRVGAELRPDLSTEDAGEWLMRTISNKRREVLPPAQLIQLMAIGRRHNCDVLAAFMLDQSGYEPPRPIKIEAEAQRVGTVVAEMLKGVGHEIERLQRLQGLQSK